MPPISRYMTRQPWTIGKAARLSAARDLMRAHHIRHLPVVDGSELVGVVSERDLRLAERLLGGDPEATVDDAMVSEVYAVQPQEPIDAVAHTMGEHKYGSVVIQNHRGEIEGVFTTVDGMLVLAEMLERVTA